ncbi:MAG TPA: anti-sigma factor [Solirubrobacteraceae bacterium]|nr:anti-sigma factor [Solirubrobacteraceae bacterium]
MTGSVPESDHDFWGACVPGYLLGALDDGEFAGFERHLAQCSRCERELATLRPAVDALAIAVPQREPAPALRDRIMATVRSEAELLSAAGADADVVRAPRRRSWLPLFALRPAVAFAGVATLLACAVLGGYALRGGGAPGRRSERVIAARVESPLSLNGTTAGVRLSGNTASLIVRNLPGPRGDRVYQVWLQRPRRPPEPTKALFVLRSGTVAIPGTVKGVHQILVTSEPKGGSRVPTQAPVIVTDL